MTDDAPIEPAVPRRSSNGKRWVIALCVLLVAIGGVLAWELRDRSNPNAPEPKGLEVTEKDTDAKPPKGADPLTVAIVAKQFDVCLPAVRKLQGYRCRFVKNERVRGKLMGFETAAMLVRHKPFSVRYHFREPDAKKGNQAIFVEGKHDNEMLGRSGSGLLALKGWTQLNPKGFIAMRYSRGPITSSGMEKLLVTVREEIEDKAKFFENAKVEKKHVKVGDIDCVLYEVAIDRKHAEANKEKTAMIRVFINDKNSLLTRFERFDWPEKPGDPEMVEYYAYLDLQPMELSDAHFDKDTAPPELPN